MKKKILVFALFLMIVVRPVYTVVTHRDQFFKHTYHVRYPLLKKLYGSSQYVVGKNPNVIPDESIEAYLAGAFLKGGDPILFIHDHPPLGKYILALSIIIFDNENAIIPFLYILSLLGIYLLSYKVSKNKVYALLPVVIFSNEPLLFIKLIYTPIPELVQLPFIIFTIYFFLQFIRPKTHAYRWAIFASLCLGGVISTRFFVLGAVLLFSQMLFLVLKKRFKEIAIYALCLPLSIIVLLLSYTKTIIDTHSILKPIHVQKYILSYHSTKLVQVFTVWDLLLRNRWHTWWGSKSISSDPNWIIMWPISAALSLVLFVGALGKKWKLNDPELVIILWVLCYGIMLSAGYTSVRYFLSWVPFFYILAFSLIYRVKLIQKFFS